MQDQDGGLFSDGSTDDPGVFGPLISQLVPAEGEVVLSVSGLTLSDVTGKEWDWVVMGAVVGGVVVGLVGQELGAGEWTDALLITCGTLSAGYAAWMWWFRRTWALRTAPCSLCSSMYVRVRGVVGKKAEPENLTWLTSVGREPWLCRECSSRGVA